MSGGQYHEKNLSTEQNQASAPVRLPGADGHRRRTARHSGQARQGPQAVERLTGTCHGAGFTRACRLTLAADFSRVFASGTRRGDVHVRVLAVRNGLRRARLGLSLPRREIRHAVERNRLKRLTRESFRHWKERLTGWDIVVTARRSASQLSNARFRISLERLWRGLTAAPGPR